jgi:hypothetical protein
MTRTRKLWLIVGTALMLALGGCANKGGMLGKSTQTWTLSTSPRQPAAVGKVEVKAGDNGNEQIKVIAEHLSAPAKAFPGTTTYVVWLVPAGAPPQNMGALNVGEKESGSFETTTTQKEFDVLVTAESDATATTPSGNRVMSATIHLPT